ncbi:ecotropic viral integration site 5 ortholog-like isoform X2 [Limulus polyphemus]|uniref:Ecotropic viral integration site 5 ortholog-like isoform X2 n=1 Tax=Limulus polyphemus TaxID=6850 RepID=A0ABM1S023_LIMPO|nr:ecotropic viral integration site 5 ortholog-like isoform X2 [Limulus polyphemus]
MGQFQEWNTEDNSTNSDGYGHRRRRTRSMNEPQHVGSMETDPFLNSSSPSSLKNNGMNGDVPQNCSKKDLLLLARLEQQNKLIESDSKSLNSLASSHSRKSSNTSQVSFNSGNSPQSLAADDEQEDVWMTWGQVVNEWGLYVKKKHAYVKDLVRKGIPHHFRGIAWQLLCNAQVCPAKNNYAEYIKSYSPCEKVIRRDIARTYPEHEFFREKDGVGQESLFNVMKAYSLHDKEVGYCQGSAFIVGLLLLQMPEEEAFIVLVRLMEDYRLREIYKPTMAELGLRMYQLECIVQEILPELHMHLQSQSFHTSMYASSWFLTLFTASLPFQLACRVMDLLLSEGMEVVFRIAIAILQLCKEDLLQLDMEGMLKYFQKEMPSKCETDPDYLINMALQVSYNSKKMKKLEKEYSVLKTKEQEEMIEMRRLRTENRILKQRIENLEQESTTLADRLIQGQVSRAQEAEDNFVIKRELVALRDKENSIRQELKEAYKQIQELHKVGSQPPSLDMYTDDIIKSLQEELVAVKLRDAEKEDLIEHLRQKIQELEEDNKILRETKPDNSIANLQEELIASKLREAEGHLAMKELRQKVADLYLMWETHLSESQTNCPSPSKKQEKTMLVQLQEDLLSAKLHEADVTAELKELRQKIMELETQNQVSLNQIRRQVEEVEKLQEKLETVSAKKRSLQSQLKEEQRKNVDLHSQMKEERVMSRIREVEQTQIIAELKQKISSLEIKNQEIVTAGQLSSGGESDDIKDLHDRLADLKAEVMRLETQNRRLISTVALQNLRLNSNGSKTCNFSEESLSHVNSLLELTIGKSNKVGDDVLSDQLLHLGRESNHMTSKDLFKNGKLNGEI